VIAVGAPELFDRVVGKDKDGQLSSLASPKRSPKLLLRGTLAGLGDG